MTEPGGQALGGFTRLEPRECDRNRNLSVEVVEGNVNEHDETKGRKIAR